MNAYAGMPSHDEQFKAAASSHNMMIPRFPTPPPSPSPKNNGNMIAKPHVDHQVHKFTYTNEIWYSNAFQYPAEHPLTPCLSPVQEAFILNMLNSSTTSIIDAFRARFPDSRQTRSHAAMEKFVFDLRWMAKAVVWSPKEIAHLKWAAERNLRPDEAYEKLLEEWVMYPKSMVKVEGMYAVMLEEVKKSEQEHFTYACGNLWYGLMP